MEDKSNKKKLSKKKLLRLLDKVDADCDEAWEKLESRDRYFDAMDELRTYIKEAEL